MSATTTPTQTTTTEAAPNGAGAPGSPATPPAEELSTEALVEAASVAAAADGSPPAEGDAPAPAEEPAASKIDVAAETLRKARKIAKQRREADARADRERLRADQMAARLEQSEKERREALEERELLKRDPLAVVRKHGTTARQLAEQAIKEGTPEAQYAALEAARAADREELNALRRQIDERDRAASMTQQKAAFFALVTPETHPVLSRIGQESVLALAQAEFAKARRNGHAPTDKQVLDWCESLLSPPQNGVAGAPKPKTNPGTTVASPVAKPTPTSRTVTADLAGRRYTTPANIADLGLEDQKEALAKMLEDAERGS